MTGNVPPTSLATSLRSHDLFQRLSVSFQLGPDKRCVADAYGVYANAHCYQWASDSATWTLRVYATPSQRLLYAARETGYRGSGNAYLFFSRLNAPFCLPDRHYVRHYRAVVTLFSPVDGRGLMTNTLLFSTRCNS